MAPQPPAALRKPSARALRHQRITGQIHPLLPAKTFRSGAATSDSFLTNKSDKRRIKSSSFASRIASSSGRIGKTTKRRRPSKKLKTSLDALADALPDVIPGEDDGAKDGKIRYRSLRSKKGALKKKEAVVKGEMHRFEVNMARLSAMDSNQEQQPMGNLGSFSSAQPSLLSRGQESQEDVVSSNAVPPTANRWAALRGYISSTMEQNPAFAEAEK